MRIAAKLATVIAAPMLLSATLAQAQDLTAEGDCATVSALLSADNEQHQKMGVTFGPKGFIKIDIDGKPGIINGATDCKFTAVKLGFDLWCTWDFASKEDAEEYHQFLKTGFDQCLPKPLENVTEPSDIDDLVDLQILYSSIDQGEEGELRVNVDLNEHKDREEYPFAVYLIVERF